MSSQTDVSHLWTILYGYSSVERQSRLFELLKDFWHGMRGSFLEIIVEEEGVRERESGEIF